MPYKEGKRWRGAVRYTPTDGSRQIRRTQLFDKMKDAEKWENKTREALELADAEKRKDMHRVGLEVLVGDWANAYMDYATATWSKGSCSDKRLAFRRLFEMTARPTQLVHEISPVVALNHLSRLKQQTTGNTANRDRKNLAAAWKWGARYLGMDKTNPFRSVDKFPEQRHPRWVPPLEDFRKVVDAATPLQRQLLLLAFHTAARRGELWKLKCSEVNLATGMIGFWTNKRRSGNAEFDELPISDMLRAHLAEWMLMSRDEELVFGSRFEGLLDINNRWLRRLCADVGVRNFGYHGIRHLSASIAIHNGATIVEVQQLLRHKSIATTQRYIHKVKKSTGAVDALDAAWRNDGDRESPALKLVR
ncbi:integrase family protein [Pseudodesulfovibrio mercurii]|uniref:Integrase family protein n=1 Tax=Pseudodesulfovibrio mercurii TaxID=641491 RepID=F0JI92_9BACT|nr:site-specific integrase [Pseudodesulfovibrio mercurii]EGB15403.1 integrase family protein [Pseudodesulfovibrio mercurii]